MWYRSKVMLLLIREGRKKQFHEERAEDPERNPVPSWRRRLVKGLTKSLDISGSSGAVSSRVLLGLRSRTQIEEVRVEEEYWFGEVRGVDMTLTLPDSRQRLEACG